MQLYSKNLMPFFVTPFVFAAAFLVFSIPQADASIKVEGDREFTDEINICLITYRNAPGIVGDVIKELENSNNEHKIINSQDWSNTPNNGDDSQNGKGTGTVSRVDKAELEKYKEKFPELVNKDFCTALLHELWHAVDADRGEWNSEKLDGVWRDEIEATTFQNFIHAIREVDPRTSYGGKDISKYVLAGDDKPKEEVKESEKPKEAAEEPKQKTEPKVAASFNHVAPGEYSEIYATITTSPGAKIEVTLSGPGVDGKASQAVTADGNGVAKLTWRIVAYGNYILKGTADGQSFSSGVNVK